MHRKSSEPATVGTIIEASSATDFTALWIVAQSGIGGWR